MSDVEVRQRVFDRNSANYSTLHRLHWLEHEPHMSENRLLRQTLFAKAHNRWKKVQGDQEMTWKRSMKVTTRLNRARNARLVDWGLQD